MKKVGLVLLVFVLIAGMFAGYYMYQQASDEEKTNELIRLLRPENGVELAAKSDGQYDKDNHLMVLARSDPAVLAGYQRSVAVQGSYDGEIIFVQTALAFVYGEYVVLPIQLFYVIDQSLGPVPVWLVEGVRVKSLLLPDSTVDDSWQIEELGEVNINQELQLAVLKRMEPVIDIGTDYSIGKYNDLSVGSVIYTTGQVNGRIEVGDPSQISALFTDGGRNLFSTPEKFRLSNELGGLAFALRDGKFELVGFLNIMEPVRDQPNSVYVYYSDVQRIIDFIKAISTK